MPVMKTAEVESVQCSQIGGSCRHDCPAAEDCYWDAVDAQSDPSAPPQPRHDDAAVQKAWETEQVAMRSFLESARPGSWAKYKRRQRERCVLSGEPW